jgi:hypothetical protein
MKNMKFTLLLIAFIGLISCSKEINEPLQQKSESTIIPGQIVIKSNDWGAKYHWAHGDDPENCAEPGANCFEEIEIEDEFLTDLDTHIGHGATGVAQYFSDQDLWKIVFPELNSGANSTFLTKLQSGNYVMSKIQRPGSLLYYVAKGGTPYEEFAFQVTTR